MAKIVIMHGGHLSLEYKENEHEDVKSALRRVDSSYSVIRHISSSTVTARGEELLSVVDEMGCGLISGSTNGDDVIKEIESLLSSCT
jgi:hypothetical protein